MERSLKPARIIFKPDNTYYAENRKWQGCPTVEKTRNGTIYTGWFSGGPIEPHPDNYCVLARSFDNGRTWEEPFMVIASVPEESYRAEDIQLWIDPDGKLWVIWVQSRVLGLEKITDGFDGIFGVWAITTMNPDDENPVWTEPRRLCDGFLRNKPTVLGNGNWLFAAYDWVQEDNRFVYYISKDKGSSFEKCLSTQKDVPNSKMFDETMVLEKNDGTLWLLVRTAKGIGRTISNDGGKTWSCLENPAYPGPCSRFYISRLSSGNVLFINHHEFTGRSHLTAFLSVDDGATWGYKLLIDERTEISYPDAVEDKDGNITMVYDRQRYGAKEILMASFTEEDIKNESFASANSYTGRIISKA